MFYQFIWQSQNDRIRREILVQNYETGGLKMIDVEKFIMSLKITWIRRILQNESKYKNLFEIMYTKFENLMKNGHSYILELKKKCDNSFWNDMFDSWNCLCSKQVPKNINDIKILTFGITLIYVLITK